MEETARRNLQGIAVAVAAALGGIALVHLLDSLVANTAPTLLLVLVLLATAWFGALPTFVATLLCLAADAWLFLEPQNSLRVTAGGDMLRLFAFALIGLFLGLVGESRLRFLTRAARRQRESEELFRALADNISQFAWMTEPGGKPFWFNQRWFDYTGASAQQCDPLNFVHPSHASRVALGYRRCMESGEPWEDTFPLRGRNGEYRWFLSRALPIRGADGRIERWFGTDTDITEQRALQEELRRSARRLEEADRRKDEFLATLAHELRNPLAPIRTGLTLLKMAGDNPAVQRQVRETLERQTDQLITLVNDLMDVSRITRGKLELRLDQVRLSSIVHSAVEASRPLLDEAGHRLEVRLPEPDPLLCCDPHRMAQVLSNLLNNAARYTPRGGLVTLEARAAEHEVAICVRDTGIGIAADRMHEIFEMFAQIASPVDGTGGLGIGLTLARSLMEMHGGSIEVTSEGENRGSEFTVRLPLPAAATGIAAASDAGTGTARKSLEQPGAPGQVTEK